MTRSRLFLAAIVTALAFPAIAQDAATGSAIRSALSGNTVQGSMSASGGYTEFYAADGQIRAADYTGTWSVVGNQMCFSYGDDPESCFGVRLAGNRVTWIGAGGDEGTGTIVAGNPNNF